LSADGLDAVAVAGGLRVQDALLGIDPLARVRSVSVSFAWRRGEASAQLGHAQRTRGRRLHGWVYQRVCATRMGGTDFRVAPWSRAREMRILSRQDAHSGSVGLVYQAAPLLASVSCTNSRSSVKITVWNRHRGLDGHASIHGLVLAPARA